MKVGALDLGTNTFLCLVAEGADGKITRVLRDEVEVVRLGQGVDKTGSFHPDALARAKACLKRFRRILDEEKVDRVLACATSAARDVENGNELFAIAHELDLPLEIISGDREARCSYSGACSDFLDDQYRLVVDIGGGSTELILGQGRDLKFARSLDIGAVRLTERMITQQPVKIEERLALENFVENAIDVVLPEISNYPLHEILAVAGTPTSLAAIELGGFDPKKIEGYRIELDRLKYWQDDFAKTSVEEKKQKYGLGGRADIIFAGVTILRALVEKLSQAGFKVSVKGLRYGVALDLLSRR